MLKKLFCICGLLLLSGCASGPGLTLTSNPFGDGQGPVELVDTHDREMFMNAASPAKNITTFEKNLTLEKASFPSHMLYCTALWQLQRYHALDACLQTYQAKIKVSDLIPHEENTKRKHIAIAMSLTPLTAPLGPKPVPVFLVSEWNQTRYHELVSFYGLDVGDYTTAIRHLKEANKLALVVNDGEEQSSMVVTNHTMLSHAYALSGQKEQAKDEVAAIKLEDNPSLFGLQLVNKNEFMFYPNLAQAYLSMGDYENAYKYSVLPKDMEFSTSFKVISGVLNPVMGLVSLLATNPLEEQKKKLEKERQGGIYDVDYYRRQFVKAKAAYGSGRTAEAESLYHELVKVKNNADFPALHFVVLHDYGNLRLKAGKKDEAIRLFKQAISVIEASRSRLSSEASKIGFVGDKQAVYADLVGLLIQMGKADEALVYAERAKSRALIDMLASQQRFEKTDQLVVPLQETAVIELDQAEAEARVAVADEKQRAADRGLLARRIEALKSQQPELASLVTVVSPQLDELQQRLAHDETLLEYFGNGDQLFVFVLSRKGVGAVKLDGSGLRESVDRFRTALTDPKQHIYRTEGLALYARLIEPVASQLTTKTVTVVPHGVLHYLPFAALPSGDGYLLDRHALCTLPSASVLSYLAKPNTSSQGMLALGNPDLKDASLDLPGAQAEVLAIVQHRKDAQFMLRDKATETVVKKQGAAFKYLHFASHGIFNPDQPLTSGLLLASDKENDGTLTVGELYNLKLSADLVTLSACETALGRVASGDDVIGFTRGFLYAGASSVVSSLWKVDDQATSELMQAFYRNMERHDKREALRLAQQNVRQKQSHPYYWAAFQMAGAL